MSFGLAIIADYTVSPPAVKWKIGVRGPVEKAPFHFHLSGFRQLTITRPVIF